MLDFTVLTILFNGLDDRLVLNPSSKASISLGIVNRGEWEADIVDGVSLRLFLLRVSWLCVGGRYSNMPLKYLGSLLCLYLWKILNVVSL